MSCKSLIYIDIRNRKIYGCGLEIHNDKSVSRGACMTLTKADIVRQVYMDHDEMTKAKAMEAVESFLRLAKDTLIGGEDLLLSGFGKFNVKDKRARRGRNPQTGSEITLAPRRVVTFSPSGILRDKVNGL